MTPKEKAKELFDKFYFIYSYDGLGIMDDEFTNDDRKECALIAVEFAREFITGDLSEQFDKFIYLQDIKEEIEKL
jgi:hypothetical protein